MEHKISLPPISDILRTPQPPAAGPAITLRPPLNPLAFTQAYPLHHYSGPASAYHYAQTLPRYMTQQPSPPTRMPSNYPPSPSSLPSISPRLLYWKLPLPSYEKPSPPRRRSHEELSLISGMKRKTRNNLPKETTNILLKWLNEHLHHPYPNSFEKNDLMAATGLNQQQLSNWFINARRRKIKNLKAQRPVDEV